ncbi:hypothetical protein D8M04_01755 [Oceanobacillus piezotolerans]|uniref:DUF3679 domain-containing protein n=1 Tax=Oceanobacillus piezotolerans TaxID=2448030 RepID=A0A498DHN4_9BACI|nr:hypothetical protein [Oceanobacillus piezotolerans]RLL48029.1 hypothetical protein D8M04_01755 [Oceanobacillus piezotolerans]
MLRIISTILLLAVFFLSGAVYGMNQEDNKFKLSENPEVSIEENIALRTEEDEIISYSNPVDQSVSEDVLSAEGKVEYTQKTASFLETSVQGFYEIIVTILYQIANIFF